MTGHYQVPYSERQTAPDAVTATMEKKKKDKKPKYPFWFGGSASMWAACFTHPLDLVKVRLQTFRKTADGVKPGMTTTFFNIVKNEGFVGLYGGLSASLLRQATYSTTRFGVYEELKSRFAKDDKQTSVGMLILLASLSGVAGSAVGNPADIINVRMQQDKALPSEMRRNYKHAVDGLIKMTRSEGVTSLFRGMVPNMSRGALMTASQLASYDEFKRLLLGSGMFQDGLVTHFTASTLAGGVATLICSPVDVIKTRIMSSESKKGILNTIQKITHKEGISWMFKGVVPAFIRLGPQTILTFVFLEQHRKMYNSVNN